MSNEVYFRATCSETRIGEHIRVVGNCQALGDWDPACGVPLHTTALDFPVWFTDNPIVLQDSPIPEYKYVICDDGGRIVRWEDTPNRMFSPAKLASSGLCLTSGPICITEAFNTRCPPDVVLFANVAGRGAKGQSSPKDSAQCGGSACVPKVNSPSKRRHTPNCYEPTMRERPAAMIKSNGRMERVRSRTLLHIDEPEVTNASLMSFEYDHNATTEQRSAEEIGGLVREESCLNMFGEEPEDDLEFYEVGPFEQNYTLLGDGPLGEGTFGLVWRCRPIAGCQERAAKIVRKARLSPREFEFLLGVDGEIKTHLTMKHPHIVELFQYLEDQNNVTMILEFCHGGDLFDAIVRHYEKYHRGIPEKQAAVATQHTLKALAYVHRQSVVHRDIKCENVLLSHGDVPLERNVFKLCDFGFAAHDTGAGFRERLGSPDTVAPEVVNGSRYSFPADIWSIGTLVYMMLSVTSPFKAPTDAEVLRRVRAGSYSLNGPLWDGISSPPKHVITSLMVVDAALRPTAEETLQKAWLKDMAPSSGQ